MASVNISDHEHEERVLAVTLAPHMFEACLGCATAGILLFMCIYGLNLFLETPKELRRSRRFYVATGFIILILHSLAELPMAYYIFQLLYKASNWQEVYAIRDELENTWWVIASDWANAILVWVGDGLLVYRCHLVWTGRRMMTVLPTTLYLAGVSVSIYQLVAFLSRSTNWDASTAYILISVGVNCVVTFLIALRLIRMQKQQAAVMASMDTKVYIGIVSILAESAVPLAVAGVIAAGSIPSAQVPSVHSKSLSSVHNIFMYLWTNLSALAPALIIFRVAAGRSWDHSTLDDSPLSTLAFQPHTSQSSGELRQMEAAPLGHDTEKNGLDRELVI